MGIISILLCTAALLFAVLAIMDRKKNLFIVISFICMGIPPIGDINDMVGRTISGDSGGIIDIYPTMFKIYVGVFVVVSVLNLISAATKKSFK